jgi:ATP-dependent Zn protease
MIDEWALKLVLEAVTGEALADPIDPYLIRSADTDDLSLAIRRGLSPSQCLERLGKILTEKTEFGADGAVLSDLHGYGEAMSWALDLIEDLKEYRAGQLDWDLVDNRGLLLAGAPGVGKTTFAAAVAKTAGIPLIATSVAEWNAASYLSGTLQRISDAFGRARRSAPSVLLIDELDGISDRSNLTGEYVEYWSQIVNYLLEHLSGIANNEGVVVIGTTNFASKIDPAIRRAGRLDRQITLTLPGPDDLAKIFGSYLAGTALERADLMPLALASAGKTGADIEAYVKRAKASARRGRRELSMPDILEQIRQGAPDLSPDVRRRVAVHEAGHVLVGRALKTGVFMAASINHAGGEAAFIDAVAMSSTAGEIDNAICLLLAGRAAERLTLGDFSVGSGVDEGSDLARATALSEMLETKGAGTAGNLYLPDDMARNLMHVAGLINAVKARLDKAEARATAILEANRTLLDRVAARLDVEGYLSAADIEQLEISPLVLEAAE